MEEKQNKPGDAWIEVKENLIQLGQKHAQLMQTLKRQRYEKLPQVFALLDDIEADLEAQDQDKKSKKDSDDSAKNSFTP